jgi:hypothetical protein
MVGVSVIVAVRVALGCGVMLGVSVAVGRSVAVALGVALGEGEAVAVAVGVSVGASAIGTAARLPAVWTTAADADSHASCPSASATWNHEPSSLMPTISTVASALIVVTAGYVVPGPERTVSSRWTTAMGVAGVGEGDAV